jgi:hypothetical protein
MAGRMLKRSPDPCITSIMSMSRRLEERTGDAKFTSDGPSQQFVERLMFFAGEVVGLVEEECAVDS